MKIKRILIVTLVIVLVFLAGYLLINNFGKTQMASLQVISNQHLPIYVDEKQVGESPYTMTIDAKSVILKIGDFETTLDLQPGIRTVVRRDFGGDGTSSGYVASFIKNSQSGSALLAVISKPNGANVSLNDESRGQTPTQLNLNSGNYQITISQDGYESVNFPVQVIDGYKLTAVVDLSSAAPSIQTQKQNETQNFQANDLKQVMVEILSTPNGFLRVRDKPTVASNEVGRVHTGEKYLFIGKDNATGWYDIQLSASASGWISNVYAATSSGALN